MPYRITSIRRPAHAPIARFPMERLGAAETNLLACVRKSSLLENLICLRKSAVDQEGTPPSALALALASQ
jgi:hypothetical protein